MRKMRGTSLRVACLVVAIELVSGTCLAAVPALGHSPRKLYQEE